MKIRLPSKKLRQEFVLTCELKGLQKGIDLCKKNMLDFLEDAKLIIAEGRLSHAYVMVEFAIEELGKIVMLQEALASDPNDPVKVKGEIFGTHRDKSKKAWKVLDTKYRLIFDEGVFNEGVFERGVFVEDTEASHKTRCECAFVDFTGSIWIVGRDIKKDLLENLIVHIEATVAKI